MADEPSLPRLAWNPTPETFLSHQARKRVRLSSPPVSSDPVFSSDDDPSADNYTQERRKRKYKGPWFRQSLAEGVESREDAQKTKRQFERQFDSGVFMGSDGTDFDEVMEALEATKDGPPRADTSQVSVGQFFPTGSSRLAPQQQQSTPETLAQEYIQQCLEEGKEDVDLSDLGLTTLSNSTIRPLATFTLVPTMSGGDFRQLEPRLKLFLASNALHALPEELLKLQTLTVLSLRSNELEEIPPGVGQLKNLKDLNLSQNNLRFLPYEILELFSSASRLKYFKIHPNPFLEPELPTTESEEHLPQLRIGLGSRRPHHWRRNATPTETVATDGNPRWIVSEQARTQIRYLNPDGSLEKGPRFTSTTAAPGALNQVLSKLPIADDSDIPTPPTPRGSSLTRAPSLIEVALQSCARNPNFPSLATLLPDESPQYFHSILRKAAEKKESGGSNCTICRKSFILPRTEWIEWWRIVKSSAAQGVSAASPLRQMENERDALESMVPLMRRGCSWLCVPG